MFIYLLLGFIQGIVEPIPISSSGHLVIFDHLFNGNISNDLNFSIFVNFGSFIAITYFYRKEIKYIIKDFFSYSKTKNLKYRENYKYGLLIIIGTIPAGIIGYLLKDLIEESINIRIVGISLLITALMLYLVKDIKGRKNKKDLKVIDALVVGLFQVIALFPGISRSGSTLVGGMIMKMNRTTAFNYSFMLYLPISIATMILGIKDINVSNELLKIYLFSMIISMITTYFSIKLIKRIVEKGKLIYFVWYCIIVGLLSIYIIK